MTAIVLSMGLGLLASPARSAGSCDLSFLTTAAPDPGSTHVLGISFKVVNDEDTGLFGYWALSAYNRQIQVWQQPDGSFYAIANYTGKFTTFKGALSPQAGVVESKDATGTFHGGYVATFDDANEFTSAFGRISTKNYGGTEADIVLGIYSLQEGPSSVYSWTDAYFPGLTNFAQPNWGWVYTYHGQSWCNAASGNSGDIAV